MKRKKERAEGCERLVIGSALRDKQNFLDLAKVVRKADMFCTFAHQQIWKAFYVVYREGLPWSPEFVFDVLEREKLLGDIPPAYLVELWEAGRTNADVYSAEKVVRQHLLRTARAILTEGIDEVDTAGVDPEDAIDKVKASLTKIVAESLPPGDDDGDDGDDADFSPFPLNALPAVLGEYCEAGAAALRCDPAFVAVPAIVAAGAAIGNSAVIRLKDTWDEPSIFWAAVVAEPSAMKSPSLDLALKPLRMIEASLAKDFQTQWKTYKNEYDEWTSKRWKSSRKGGSGDEPPKPSKPVQKKILMMDTTSESLGQTMFENPHGVVVGLDELAGWFASFSRYSDGGGASADMSMWLQLFGGRPYRISRKGGDPPDMYIHRASCSVTGGIQPKILQRCLSSEAFDSGLAARLLVTMPRGTPGDWTEDVIPEDVKRAYLDLIASTYYEGVQHLESSGGDPAIVTFDDKGKAAWVGFYNEWNKRLLEADGEAKAALAKMRAYCARFCLLLAVADKRRFAGKELAVNESHVFRAYELVQWFAFETDRVYHRLRKPADAENREKLLAYVAARGGSITPRELHKSNKKRYETSEAAEKSLNELVEKHLGTWGMKPPGEKGGRPSKVFHLSKA